jgi:hypothetical protein
LNKQENLTLKGQLALQQAADLRTELSRASIERKKVEIEYNLKRNPPRTSIPDVGASGAAITAAVDQALAQDGRAESLRDEIQKLEAAIDRAGGVIKNPEDDPSVRKMRRELEATRQALRDHVATTRGRIEEQLLNKSGNAPAAPLKELADLAQKLAFYGEYEKILKDLVDEQSSEAKKTHEPMSLQFLQGEIRRQELVYDKIGMKLEQLLVEEENPTHRIELFEKASKAK